MRTEPKTTDDYIFYDKYGKFLDEQSLTSDQVEDYARRVARRHRCTVTVAAVVYFGIEPNKCAACWEIAPESGPCWCSSFEDEIPFSGEPMAGPERTAKEIYGIE